jgi:hypothetical protein
MALTILDPTATPKLRVSLSLTETETAVTCSVDKIVQTEVRNASGASQTSSIAHNG